jgi:hypothetical protein
MGGAGAGMGGAGAGMGGAGAGFGGAGGAGMTAADPFAGMGGAGMAGGMGGAAPSAAAADPAYAALAGLAPSAAAVPSGFPAGMGGAGAGMAGMGGAGAGMAGMGGMTAGAGAAGVPAGPPPGSNAANIFIDPETGGNWNRTYMVGESPEPTENDMLVKMVVANPIEQLGPVSEGMRQVVSRTVGTWANNVYWFDAQPAPETVAGAPPGSTELTLLVHNPNMVERSRQMSMLVNRDMIAGLMRATAAGGVEVVPGSVKGSYAVQPKKAGPAAAGLAGLTGGEFDRLYQQLNAPPPPPPMNVTNATALEPVEEAEKDGAVGLGGGGSGVVVAALAAVAAAVAVAL